MPSTIDEDFGPSLREVRQHKGMSQDDLAAALAKRGHNISQATVGKIERGERRVTIGEASDIAHVLGKTLSHFTVGGWFVTEEILQERLRQLRNELLAAMGEFESGQELVALQAGELEHQTDMLADAVMEPLEQVLEQYRRDRIAENQSRRIRDELDGPVGDRTPSGLLGQRMAEFGDRSTHGIRDHASSVIFGPGAATAGAGDG